MVVVAFQFTLVQVNSLTTEIASIICPSKFVGIDLLNFSDSDTDGFILVRYK